MPIVKQVSQRLIVCLAAMFHNSNIKLYLQNITQAYVQSISNLNQKFYIQLLLELILLLGASFNRVIKVMKLLYSVLKVSNYWFAIYHTYHKKKLKMIESIYNPHFLYNFSLFSIVRMQTDNTLILINNHFASTKKDAIRSVKIMIKNREHFTPTYFLKFNSAQIKLKLNGLVLTKKSYIEGILLVIDYTIDSTS